MDINDVKKAYQEHDEYYEAVEHIVGLCMKKAKEGRTLLDMSEIDCHYFAFDADAIADRLRGRGFSVQVCEHEDNGTYYLKIFGWAE